MAAAATMPPAGQSLTEQVTDTLALTHGNPHAEEEEAAATPRREMRRIGSEQELEAFEKHFEVGG